MSYTNGCHCGSEQISHALECGWLRKVQWRQIQREPPSVPASEAPCPGEPGMEKWDWFRNEMFAKDTMLTGVVGGCLK